MQMSLDCIPCIVNSFLRLFKNGFMPSSVQATAMRQLLSYLSTADYQSPPPVLGQGMHRMIRNILGDPDPYKKVKDQYNQMMLKRYAEFSKMVSDAEDAFDKAMRLAIAGNAIDFGPQHLMDVRETIQRVLKADLAIDHSERLRDELAKAERVLYIGDNCGEIVLDRLFLETIGHPGMTFCVRGAPVINDATLQDAEAVGIDKYARIISTGDDAPGVVWDSSSDTFKSCFRNADVIIAKGQGNLEGLLGMDANIYFMLVTKCEPVARKIDVQPKQFIVMGPSVD
jgi:uncharacterized protein with ATP-grasp and redox domains